ncbi:hypothetical protein NHX12_010624 [Muraenolepis orangiensis]|uniref:Mediator of RNA polymerase II transcription subunit 13-like n=1 Tax=Muraenolepis orangiensis TaxID=630683 RepID=A0A9Q0I7G4_9TELE|nr:hypothetical protein NHX12_010624 [Muraenolepis orangiensis]
MCTSVEINQHQPVYHLTVEHLTAAQQASSPFQVILSPFGLNGMLTGQSFKLSDPPTQKLIEDWNQFYPISPGAAEGPAESMDWEDDSLASVEVLVGGVRMVYPACLVLVPQSDIPAPPPTGSAHCNASLYPGHQTVPASQREAAISSVTLTPPTLGEKKGMDSHTAQKWVRLSSSSLSSATPDGFNSDRATRHGGKVPRRLAGQAVERVWRECNIKRAPNNNKRKFPATTNGTCDEQLSERVGSWDFVEPSQRSSCNCSRYKAAKQRAGGAVAPPPSGGPPSSHQSPGKHKAGSGGDKSEKADKQQKRPQTPFHHRAPAAFPAARQDVPAEAEGGGGGGGTGPGPRGPDAHAGNRFSAVRAGHAGDTPTPSKPPPVSSSSTSEEQDGSPPAPPLSPRRPCDEAAKTPASPGPNSQHFYQPGPPEDPLTPHYHHQHQHHHHQGASYPEPPEATVYVGAAVSHAEEDGPPTPWRFFNLPRRKEAELHLPPPLLPGDKLMRDKAPPSTAEDCQPLSATE